MFSFAIFVQRIDFEQLQFHKVGVALAEFESFQLILLRAFGESFFKAPKVLLEEFFYHGKVHCCYFFTKGLL